MLDTVNALTIISSGSVTSFTASSALRPVRPAREYRPCGTDICGSSSRGSETRAMSPSSKRGQMNSGVNADPMKARVNAPAMPKEGLRGVTALRSD